MSSFKTPLLKVLALYILLLVILGKFYGFNKNKYQISNDQQLTTNYQLIKGTVRRPLAKGWVIKTNNNNLLLTSRNPQDLIRLELIPGSEVSFWAREIAVPQTTVPQLWDWNDYLSKEGIHGQYILDRGQDLGIIKEASGFFSGVYRYHQKLLLKINNRFKNTETSGFLAGLLLGDKRLLQNSLKESFQDAGVMHLLVASGLHVSLWAGLIWLVGSSLLGLPRKLVSGIALVSLWLFVIFIGINPPVVRAAIMVTVLLAGPLLKRETPALARLSLTALFFLIADPRLIHEASFLLSFVSTFGILLGLEGVSLKKRSVAVRWVLGVLLTSFFAWWSLLPITARFFHEISLIGPLANMILVPSSSLILGMGILHFIFLDWVPFLGPLSGKLLGFLSFIFIQTTRSLGHLPLATLATKSWDLYILLGWGFFSSSLIFRKQAKVLLAFGCFSLFLSTVKILLTKQKIYLLSDGETYQALFTQKGFRKDFVLAREQNHRFSSQLQAFAKTQGLKGFDPRKQLSTTINCGDNTLIFPLTAYPIMSDGEILPTKKLICNDRHFL